MASCRVSVGAVSFQLKDFTEPTALKKYCKQPLGANNLTSNYTNITLKFRVLVVINLIIPSPSEPQGIMDTKIFQERLVVDCPNVNSS